MAALKSIQGIIVNELKQRCIFHFLQLSMRSQSILQRYGMVTLGSLTEKSRMELLSMPGFSRIMVKELQEELSHWGLSLAADQVRKR